MPTPCQLQVWGLSRPAYRHLKMLRAALQGAGGDRGSRHTKEEQLPPDWPVLPPPWGAKEQPGAEGKASSPCRCHSPRASRGQEGGGTKGLYPERRWPPAPTPRRPQECPLRTPRGCWKTEGSGLSCPRSPPPSSLAPSSNTPQLATGTLNARPRQPTL